MTDYEKLYQELMDYYVRTDIVEFHPVICTKAAYAIMDLMKERDELIESVRGICWWCKKSGDFSFSQKEQGPWFECEHMNNEKDEPCRVIGYRCPYWEFENKMGGK